MSMENGKEDDGRKSSHRSELVALQEHEPRIPGNLMPRCSTSASPNPRPRSRSSPRV